MAISLQTMLEKISIRNCQVLVRFSLSLEAVKVECLQFPSTVAQLGACLADVKMTDL
jgi:hypothetical protein